MRLRQIIVAFILGRQLRRAIRPRWRRALKGIDGILIGGGNLISDIDLNFPLKIEALSLELKEMGIPVGLMAVGVADNWTPWGERLFRAAFSQLELAAVFVRDAKSKEIWERRMKQDDFPAAVVCPDPAVLAFSPLAGVAKAAAR